MARSQVVASVVASAAALTLFTGATGCRSIFGLDDPDDRVEPDAPPVADADPSRLCWGTEVEICLPSPAAQAGPKTLAGTIDTSTSPLCEPSIAAYCVVWANTLTVGAADVTGGRPLVLIGADSIVVGGTLDAASRAGKPGPGAMGASCSAFAAQPTAGRGGGAGGTLGGAGGTGGTASDNAVGGEPAPAPALTGPRAGCRGQDGGGAVTHLGFGGLGGGAAYLISGRAIQVYDGVKVNASGGGGGGATCTGNCAGSTGEAGGGGGGGSGGMLILEAPAISSSGFLFADGGGGGEGASGSNGGRPGGEPDGTRSAPGGTGGANNGGDGGAGSYNSTTAGAAGQRGESSLSPPGGGGGGGGAGVIRVYGAPRIDGGITSPSPEIR
jgi:hypothetical protein